jgi:Leucine-rich repeat (LRR) protein
MDLAEFPLGITHLYQLERLVLSENQIERIPFDIGNLKNLVFLDMWSNELSYFPDSMRELTQLKEFDLRVIQLSKAEKAQVIDLLPNTKIHFSQSCNCSP